MTDPLDSLIAFLAHGHTADELWSDLVVMRANGCQAADLPATEIDLLRLLVEAKVAGRVIETVDGVWKPGRPLVMREPQGQLF